MNLKKLFTILYYWLPPIIWMSTLFYLSSQPSVKVADEYTVNFLAHKIVHVIVYAFLYLLLFRAFHFLHHKKVSMKTYMYPLIISILYGASDEYHQTLVPTRQGKIQDVFIDTLGISLMFLYTKFYLQRLKFLL